MKKRNGWVLFWCELRRVASQGFLGLAWRCLPKNDDDVSTIVAFHNLYAAMIFDLTAQMERRKKERETQNGK